MATNAMCRRPARAFREYFERADVHNAHAREVQLLAQRLALVYGSEFNTFDRVPARRNAEVDAYADAVVDAFVSVGNPPRPLRSTYTNPYAAELTRLRREAATALKPARTAVRIKQPPAPRLPERMEQLRYILYYGQAERVFGLLEQVKARFTDAYQPAGVQYYARGTTHNPDMRTRHLEACNLCHLLSDAYEAHKGLALHPELLRRADSLLDWKDLVRTERRLRLALRTGRVRAQVAALREEGGPLARLLCVFMVQASLG